VEWTQEHHNPQNRHPRQESAIVERMLREKLNRKKLASMSFCTRDFEIRVRKLKREPGSGFAIGIAALLPTNGCTHTENCPQ